MKSSTLTTRLNLVSTIVLSNLFFSVVTFALPNGASSSSGSNSPGSEGVEELFQDGIWDPQSYDPLELFIDVPSTGIGSADPDYLIPWVKVQPQIDHENLAWQRVLIGAKQFDRPRFIGQVHLREKEQRYRADSADYVIKCNFFQDDGKQPSDPGFQLTAIGKTFSPEEKVNVSDLADGVMCQAWIAKSFEQHL